MLHKHGDIGRLFHDLRFIIIDEVHALMRGDRGGQTLCLIERLCRASGARPRRIGLSATIGDPARTGIYMSAGSGRRCTIPQLENVPQTWRLSMEHFYTTGSAGSSMETLKKSVSIENDAHGCAEEATSSRASGAGKRLDQRFPNESPTGDLGGPAMEDGVVIPSVSDTAPASGAHGDNGPGVRG